MVRTLHLNLSRRTVVANGDEQVWDGAVIAAQLRGASALRHVLHFGDVRLHLDNMEEALSSRPMVAARLLSHGSAAVHDGYGRVRQLGWLDLVVLLLRHVLSVFAWPAERAFAERNLAALLPAPIRQAQGEGVVVVRTDLWFGLEAGGAVAHTAGLLNALALHVQPLRMVSAHDVPTLSSCIERITPRWRRLGRAEHSLVAYNRALIAAAQILPCPRFVYQRFGLYGYAGAVLASRWGAPLVLEYNGSEVWIGDHWGKPVAARSFALEVERRMLGAADLITAVSKAALEQAVERGAPRERVLLLPNGVDADQYRPDIEARDVRRRYALGDSIVIGFIGTFGAWHGAQLLAEAFVSLKRRQPARNIRLLLIGDGPQLPAARRVIEDAELGSAAAFTGLVLQAEGAKHLAAADILVSPTLANPDGGAFFGSPTKLFEYMAMGRAIVASDLAQLGEVLEHERTALLTLPGDAVALGDALERLCEDEALRRRLGEAAREEAVAHHTWTRRSRSLLAAVEALT